MNAKAKIVLDDFMLKFDKFLDDCSTAERSGDWDTERFGSMSAYFESDLFAVVLQMMSADGVFEHAEAEVISTMFSHEYAPRELNDMYRSLKPVIDDYCDDEAQDSVRRLRRVNRTMSETYKELILSACDVVSLSDGIAEGEEVELIARLRGALDA